MHTRTAKYLVSICLAVVVVAAATAQTTTDFPVGVVEYLEGRVTVNGVVADFGQEVPLGAWVQCGPNAYVDIVFDQHNVFRLGENTVAEISLGREKQEVDLRFGTLAAVFDRVRRLAGDDSFRVRTPTAIGGVRGTSFFFKVVDANETYVCTCNGTVDWADAHGDDPFTVSAPSHEAYTFRSTSDGVVVEQGTLLYHNSDTMDEVADVVGTSIPWGTIE